MVLNEMVSLLWVVPRSGDRVSPLLNDDFLDDVFRIGRSTTRRRAEERVASWTFLDELPVLMMYDDSEPKRKQE